MKSWLGDGRITLITLKGGLIMKDKAFETIQKFCVDNKLSKLHERILLHKYYEDYYTLIEDHKKKESCDPSVDTIKGFNATLWNEMTLKTNVTLANDEIKNYTEKEINKIKRTQSNMAFWKSTLSSIVGSIIFTFLLILLFTLAQSQIKTWVNDLYENNNKIESTVNGDKSNPDKDKTDKDESVKKENN